MNSARRVKGSLECWIGVQDGEVCTEDHQWGIGTINGVSYGDLIDMADSIRSEATSHATRWTLPRGCIAVDFTVSSLAVCQHGDGIYWEMDMDVTHYTIACVKHGVWAKRKVAVVGGHIIEQALQVKQLKQLKPKICESCIHNPCDYKDTCSVNRCEDWQPRGDA